MLVFRLLTKCCFLLSAGLDCSFSIWNRLGRLMDQLFRLTNIKHSGQAALLAHGDEVRNERASNFLTSAQAC